jgi:hypothetical protein
MKPSLLRKTGGLTSLFYGFRRDIAKQNLDICASPRST